MTPHPSPEAQLRAENAELRAQLAEAEIQRVSVLLDTLLDTAPIGFCFVDRDLRYVRVNERLAEINGISAAAHLGRHVSEIVPTFVERIRDVTGRILATGEAVLNHEFSGETPAAPGVTRFWSESWYPVRDDVGEVLGFGAIVEEITARKQADEALRTSEEFARTILQSSPDCVKVLDGEGRLQFINTNGIGAMEIDDFAPFRNQPWWNLWGEENTETIKNAVATALQSGTAHLQALRPTAKGTMKWWDVVVAQVVGSNPKRLVSISRDLSERHDADEKLRASEERFRAAAGTVIDIIWTNNPEGEMEGEQRAWGAFTGQRPEEYRGFGWSKAVHPEDAQPTIDAWNLAVAEKRLFEFEHRLRRHDGAWRLCTIRAVPLLKPTGEIREWVGVHRDITERKRAEEKLRIAKEGAETANAAKDRFLAMLSHELRTPLTPVLMAVAALEHDPALSAEVREDLAMIKRNIELETKLIDDLLDLTRITSGKLPLDIKPVDLNETIRHVCEICRPSVREKGIHLETKLDAATGLVAADAPRLQQVLWNVLRNAIKFTPENGWIRVTATRLDVARCQVRVEDSGIGISPEILPRIFDAFEQGGLAVTRQFGGLGLGLAICKGLVELHHGSVRAESSGAGKGATFIMELPRAPAMETAGAVAPSAGAKAFQQLRLLVVDDHADTVRTLARLLGRAGFVVVTASDVASAVATAERESFDLLICDLGLPDGSGYDVMKRLGTGRTVRGIALSGYGMAEDVRRSREAGFAEHLVKPIEVSRLMDAIERVTKNRD